MRLEDLKPGHLYKLTEDVPNPGKLDRRSSNFFKKVDVFAADTYFACFSDEDARSSVSLRVWNHRGCRIIIGFHHPDGFREFTRNESSRQISKALAPSLEEVPLDSWKAIMKVFRRETAASVLRELWEAGDISTERMISLLRKHEMDIH